MIGKFIHLLNQSGADLDDRQIAEALWLSRHITIREAAGTDEKKRKSDSDMSKKTPAAEQPAAQPQTTQPVPNKQPIFLAKQHESGGVPVSKIRAPGVASLPAALMICRALRPFARRVESNRIETLDEAATVQLSAEISGKDHPVLLPVMKPAKERWFEVAVVVEDTPTMAIWRPTIDELVLLLGRHGAFRDARLWLLRFGNRSARLVSTSGAEFDTMTLNDFCSRRLMMLVSDCVSPRWRDGSMANLIDEWAKTMPVVIGHMLSKRLWRRTALGEPTGEVKAARPGATNKDLIIANVKWWDRIEENAEADEEDLEGSAEPSREDNRIACPVISLDPKLISEWAKMVMSPGRRYPATLLSPNRKPSPVPQKDEPAVTPTAESLIERYRMMVSPEAFDLAVYLSFMPLALPVMRVIQQAMIPNPRQEQLAEFLMGGLLKRKDPDAEHTDRESIQYEFHDGVRELLRSEIRRYEVAPVLHCVSEFVGRSINSVRDFIAWAQDPRGADQAQLGDLPFAQIGLDGLEQLGYPRYVVSHGRISVDETTNVSGHEPATSSQIYSRNIDAPQERPFAEKERGKELISYINNALRAVTEVQSNPPGAGRSGRLGIFSLPFPRNKFFIGRDDILKDIHMNFKAGKMVQALSGIGGGGKTQIALEYAYRYQKSYQVVLWGNAHSRESLVSDFVAMAGLLKLPEIDVQDQGETLSAVKRWFENNDGWLLIIDNADDLAIVREFIPSRETGHVLLTTRAQNTQPIAARQAVEGMGPQEGALFLLRRLRIIKKDESIESAPEEFRNQAEALSKAVDDLPLALDQAAAFIEEMPSTLEEYQTLYQSERKELLKRRGRLAEDHPSVTVTFSLAFKKVAGDNPAAADLLRVCAFLEANSIPEEIFSEGAKELGEGLASAAESPLALPDAIGEAARFSLLWRHPEARMLSLHRLVQAVLKDEMDENSRRVWAERAVRAVNKVFPTSEYSNWQACSRLIRHAQSLARSIDEFRFEFPEAARMLNQAGEYLNELAQYADAGPLFRRALAIREKVFGIEHASVASSLNNLAGLYYNLGKYAEAESIWKRALAITEKTGSDENLSFATGLNNLAELYKKQGKYVDAEPLYQRALAIYKKVSGDESTNVALVLNNLAELYLYQGRYTEAEPLFKRALDIRTKMLSAGHPRTSDSLNGLAVLYYRQGRYAEAEPLAKRALDVREKAFGAMHPEVANSLNNLAELYRKQGNYAEAESLDRRALDIREKALSADHPDVATSLNNLALSYSNQRRYAEAERLYRRALDIREKALDAEHPEIAKSLENLAGLYFNQGKYAEAEPLLKRTLDTREKALGPEHPDTASSLNNLALLYHSQGRYAEAEPLFKRALDICEKALGPEHPSTASSLNNLAELYRAQGRYEEATPLYQRALDIYEKALGPEHPDTASSLNNLALLYHSQGRYAEAEPLYKRAIDVTERALGPEHPSIATNLNNLALLYHSQGRYEEAEPLFKRALSICEKALGAEHPSTANSLNNLALLYDSQGRYEEVEPLYQRALDVREKALGPEHPDTAMSLNNLALLYRAQGRYEEAEPLFKRTLDITEKALGPRHPHTITVLKNYAALLRKMSRDDAVGHITAQGWIDRVIRPSLQSLRGVEYLLAQEKVWTWRHQGGGALEKIPATERLVDPPAKDSLEHFVEHRPEVQAMMVLYDRRKDELLAMCRRLQRALEDSKELRSLYERVKTDGPVADGDAISRELETFTETERLQSLAESIVNRRHKESFEYTFRHLWSRYYDEFLALRDLPNIRPEGERVDRAGDETLETVRELISLLKETGKRLADKNNAFF